MLKYDSIAAWLRRDQEIRVDNSYGEALDDPDLRLWDEFCERKDDEKQQNEI